MPKILWNAKREPQYTHIKNSLLDGGKPESVAQKIAARVVNKQRGLKGRSAMNKAQLETAFAV